MTGELLEKLKAVKLIVSDVDGVLTDGRIYLTAQQEEIKAFHARDSFRIEVATRSGLPIVWFTGRKSPAVIKRSEELGARLLFKQDVGGGLFALLTKEYQVAPRDILYIGDDWSDLWLMKNVGLSATPSDGTNECKAIASIITQTKGGWGVLAEVIEIVMRAKGTWDPVVTAYTSEFIF